MKYYDLLKDLQDNKKIQLQMLFSIPRTNSSAFEIALSHGADIQCSYPFLTDLPSKVWDADLTDDFDRGCKAIYDHVIKEMQKFPAHQKALNILIKSHAGYLNQTETLALLKLCNKVGFSIRDPYSQLKSMITRMGNDKLSPGGNSLNFDQAKEKLIENKCLGETINIVQIHWTRMMAQYNLVKNNKISYIIQDGFALRAFPEQSIKNACQVFEYEFNAEKMLHHWENSGDNYKHVLTENWGEGKYTNAWNGPVRKGKAIEGLSPDDRFPSTKDIFPSECHTCIEGAENIYRSMMSDAAMTYHPTENELIQYQEISPAYVSACRSHVRTTYLNSARSAPASVSQPLDVQKVENNRLVI